MFRFLHAADVHLDSPLAGLERYDGAPVDEIRGATRKALENLVELALREEVDFVLIAGDLYDGDWKDYNTGLFFVAQMARLRAARVPLYLIAGNHDAANKMTRSLRLPANPAGDAVLFDHRHPETRRLADLGVAIHGRGFATAAELSNIALEYPRAAKDAFNIGLLHTSLTGFQGHDPYAPCTIGDLRSKEYQYWALGHVHTRQVLSEDPFIVFPGNLQGRHIRETGPKGCYLVTVDDRQQVDSRFEPLDVFRWELCDVDCGGADDAAEVYERFATRLSSVRQVHGSLPVGLRVLLRGASAAHRELAADPERCKAHVRATALEIAGGNAWIEKVKIATSLPERQTGDEVEGPLGELAAVLEELASDRDALVKLRAQLASWDDLARKLPSEVLRGPDALALNDPDWLRRMLTEVEPLLLDRLTAPKAD
jgi:exonuclease SbcD